MPNHIDSERLGKMMQRILRELKSIGEPTRFGELLERVEADLGLSEWDRQQLEKSG